MEHLLGCRVRPCGWCFTLVGFFLPLEHELPFDHTWNTLPRGPRAARCRGSRRCATRAAGAALEGSRVVRGREGRRGLQAERPRRGSGGVCPGHASAGGRVVHRRSGGRLELGVDPAWLTYFRGMALSQSSKCIGPMRG
jgi:hypothetical protein